MDYSSLSFDEKQPLALLPLSPATPADKLNAEFLTEQLRITAIKINKFKLVEREQLPSVLKELALQESGLMDAENTAKIGKFTGSKLLLSGKIYRQNDKYVIFLKLIRVETAETLSATRAHIDPALTVRK